MNLPLRLCCWPLSLSLVAGGWSAARAQQGGSAFAPYAPATTQTKDIKNPFPVLDADAKKLPGRAKMVKTIMHMLGQMRPTGSPKKGLDDYWAVSIGELDKATLNADVRFGSMHSQEPSADYLADYMVSAPQGKDRSWRAFARFKTSDDAEKFVVDLRQQYDAMVEYRDKIAEIYHARTTRRC